MKGLLIRVGLDQTFGGWNAPCSANGSFCYIPIPEVEKFEHGFETTYDEFEKAYCDFTQNNEMPAIKKTGIKSPFTLCHLDPDFRFLTYGDTRQRAQQILKYFNGSQDNFIVFYASFKQINDNHNKPCELVYAIIGFYQVKEIVYAKNVLKENKEERNKNAHTRLINYQQKDDIDVIIYGEPNKSGKLEKLIPIGEWRNNAYRVKTQLLDEWGDISITDGYIILSAYLPHFCRPDLFKKWFDKQNPKFLAKNNI